MKPRPEPADSLYVVRCTKANELCQHHVGGWACEEDSPFGRTWAFYRMEDATIYTSRKQLDEALDAILDGFVEFEFEVVEYRRHSSRKIKSRG